MTATDYLSAQRTLPSGLILREEGGEAIIEGRVVPYGEWSLVDNPERRPVRRAVSLRVAGQDVREVPPAKNLL